VSHRLNTFPAQSSRCAHSARGILLAACIAILIIGTIPTQANETNTVLKLVEQKLKITMANLKPAPTFEILESSRLLTVSYLPQKFLVHSADKTGRYSENPTEQVGPSYQGLVMRARVLTQDDEKGQRMLMSNWTKQEPYWQTDGEIFFISMSGDTNKIECAVSYGKRIDKELLEKIKTTLRALSNGVIKQGAQKI
jgi:hypothetical protein